ncbi:MAG: hypothetical protein ABL952_16960, partial [Pyrinomonadaceae bacterium]
MRNKKLCVKTFILTQYIAGNAEINWELIFKRIRLLSRRGNSMFCPECGIEERQSNQFCRACGTD